jgi:DNA-binding transcriptional LysR family regulator
MVAAMRTASCTWSSVPAVEHGLLVRLNALSGRMQIGVIPTISPCLLPVEAPALRRAYPRLTVVWREDKTADLVRQLQDGGLDAALLALEADIGDVERRVRFFADPSPHRTVGRHHRPRRLPPPHQIADGPRRREDPLPRRPSSIALRVPSRTRRR